jgi:sugar phosphate isomerase/epimerase
LGLVADPANFIDGANIDKAAEVLGEMYATLVDRMLLAHGKDFRRLDQERRERHHHPSDPALYGGVEYPAAGLGDMDYGAYLKWLAGNPNAPPLIIEHVEEADVKRAKAFVEEKLAGLGR